MNVSHTCVQCNQQLDFTAKKVSCGNVSYKMLSYRREAAQCCVVEYFG